MSDLSATQCGCGGGCGRSGFGLGCVDNSCIWIILLLLFCGGGCGGGCGFGGGDDCCEWIIILILLFSCCGGSGSLGGCGC